MSRLIVAGSKKTPLYYSKVKDYGLESQGGDSLRKPTGGLGLEKNYYP